MQSIGVIQEQHPARTRLFNQWKRLDMTVLVDPLNALDVSAVPIVLLVDQGGVIRYRRPTLAQVREFLTQARAPATSASRVPGEEWAEGDRTAMLGQVEIARQYYEAALEKHPDDARLNFRLGVVHRMKYDSSAGAPEDFKTAIRYWNQALSLNPNQYIWRRRIQQYGPILDKPYPFYDWVSQAREEIKSRGETPYELAVEPRGAELAGPRTRLPLQADAPLPPDPEGKIMRDKENSVIVDTIVVRSTNRQQQALRVHLSLQPNEALGYAWNNEADPVTIWINRGAGLKISHQYLQLLGPARATSRERRQADFEVRWTDEADAPSELRGYALYHACEKKTGLCIYRRKDLTIRVAH